MKTFLIGFLFGVALLGCGGGPGEPFVASGQACMPNDTKECICPGGAKGAQTCADDGTMWGKCTCTGDPGGTGGTSGSTGSGGTNLSGDAATIPTMEAAPPKPPCEGRCDAPMWTNSTCYTGCSAQFDGTCDGSCKGTCDDVSTDGNCQGHCLGICLGRAVGSCQAACTGDFAGKCAGTCAAK